MKRFFVKVVYSNGCVIRTRMIASEFRAFFSTLDMADVCTLLIEEIR